ncbi:hypothetical protein, conserved [Plasmodium gonderi]|uniref:Matrin-type domain-containing protein n=1 Tax=Plasmodium gonderi TaxID=77519 RepID=A0A1Y1JKY6_PLAGO|nr:hypothetical protein, conserved [Plasmodium gonderi]GAW83189.1 hypothetical protein, conserved [Plasmodium gonderi]
MTTFWVSTKKHYCETCNCWLSGHKVNIKNHEKSARHVENLRKLISESFKRKEQETKEKEFLEKELRKLENVEKKYLSNLNKNETSPQQDGDNKLNTPYSYANNISNNRKSNNNNEGINCSNNRGNRHSSHKKWILMVHEDTGSLIFFNRLKNDIVYEKPKDFHENLLNYEPVSEQNGWHKYFDYNSNNYYYFNIYSSKSIWEYSINRISTLIDFIDRCDEAEEKKISSNYTENVKLNTDADPLSGHHVLLNRNMNYANYPQEYIPNSYYIHANYNSLSNAAGNTMELVENSKKEMINRNRGKDIFSGESGGNTYDSTQYNKMGDAFSVSTNDRMHEDGEKIVKEKNNIKGNASPSDSNTVNEVVKTEKVKSAIITNKFNKSNIGLEGNKNNMNSSFSFKEEDNNNLSPYREKEKNGNTKKDKEGERNKTDEKGQIKKDCAIQMDESSKPGTWEVVENEINIISNENVEKIFYNIKSKEEIEKEKIAHLEDHIRYEYSEYNEFYIKKKELENEKIYLNQEFKFVDKPIYKKIIDKNRDKKVEFAKRSIKGMMNKKKIA